MKYFRSKASQKEYSGRDEDNKFKDTAHRTYEKEQVASPSSKNDVIAKTDDKSEIMIPSKRLISESKDILSDGSDSDVLVIDMGMASLNL